MQDVVCGFSYVMLVRKRGRSLGDYPLLRRCLLAAALLPRGDGVSPLQELSEEEGHSCCPQPLHMATFKVLVCTGYIYIYGVYKKT